MSALTVSVYCWMVIHWRNREEYFQLESVGKSEGGVCGRNSLSVLPFAMGGDGLVGWWCALRLEDVPNRVSMVYKGAVAAYAVS